MRITLNGEDTDLPAQTTILGLLQARNLAPQRVAVEVNRRLVRTPDYGRPLNDGDVVEIVTFVGGG